MLFREKSTSEGFHYTVEDVFGLIEITSPAPLRADTLDALTMQVLRSGQAAGYFSSFENKPIRFTFRKSDVWLEDEEEEVIH